MKLLIATTNKGKLGEITARLPLSFFVVTPADIPPIPAPEETENTFAGNALLKARYYAGITGLPALADDSGLIIDQLDGAPGVYSSRYAGIDASDSANIKKVLHALGDSKLRSARFQCVLALACPGGNEVTFEGTCEGRIAFEPLGFQGFGYDPIFIAQGDERTFAQLSKEEKQTISHRGKALDLFEKFIQKTPTFCG